MLLNNLFHTCNQQIDGFDIKATVVIDATHQIFEGHFPGHPVVPGVCMMQMIKEMMEEVIGRKTNLIKAHDLKFLALIDPSHNNNIQVNLKYSMEEDGSMIVNATLLKDELIHFKFRGQFGFQ
ncbi:3-hydroxyacyl-ACP dehydratase [soil metagenome]